MVHKLNPVAPVILAASVAFTFSARAEDDQKAKLIEQGKASYAMCLACHGADGQGLPMGAKKMAAPLSKSDLVNGDPAVFSLIVMKGIAKENQDYLGVMAPLGAAFDDEKLAAVVSYVRNSFGNQSSVVTPEDMKKYREQWKEITTPVTRAKLKELEEAAKKQPASSEPAKP